MLRSVGSVIFGIASDRYGRKWPFIVNNILFIVLELATGFTNNYSSFLACRALFGIAMGGLYGNAAATAMEDCPPQARGIISGMFQAGYPFGYLLATVFSRGLVNTTSHGWRPLFWFGACPPVLIIIFRLSLPETSGYQERRRLREAYSHATKTFLIEAKLALKKHWLLLIYLVLLMAGVNFIVRTKCISRCLFLSADFLVSRNARSISDTAAKSVPVLSECSYCNASRGKPRCNERRHHHRLPLRDFWTTSLYHCLLHHCRSLDLPV